MAGKRKFGIPTRELTISAGVKAPFSPPLSVYSSGLTSVGTISALMEPVWRLIPRSLEGRDRVEVTIDVELSARRDDGIWHWIKLRNIDMYDDTSRGRKVYTVYLDFGTQRVGRERIPKGMHSISEAVYNEVRTDITPERGAIREAMEDMIWRVLING